MRSFAIIFGLTLINGICALAEPQATNPTSYIMKQFTYAGSLLPPDWSLVSVLNDRVKISFKNGTDRNSLMEELEPGDRTLVQRLQSGTLFSTPLSSARERLSQWSSSVTSMASGFEPLNRTHNTLKEGGEDLSKILSSG